MPNALARESSPYLLQHQNNPVDWHPWGPEALARARREDKPIFLSIGYSACHWCHVMEHESFENPRIAALVNGRFVAIKVDREERPDLDQIYMNATQMMTGRGGWPMSVFLTPALKPFYAGTYFPPTARGGMPGFDSVLIAVSDAWVHRRAEAESLAEQLTAQLAEVGAGGGEGELSRAILDKAAAQLDKAFDPQWGGFGRAPKFPHSMDLQVLLRHWRRTGRQASLDMATTTLDRMSAGGIYDHLGGGFARYSVDARWLVPHFEKMLYDNALLSIALVEAFQATGAERYAQVARETLDYVLRDMTDPAGGFYSTEDADSEGEEGLFYTWTPAELVDALGEERAATFARAYDVTEVGNFEGRSILNLPKTIAQTAKILGREEAELAEELAESRAALFAIREKRVHPGKDDKVLVAWNGLMIDALAKAGALGEPRYVEAAARAAEFILQSMRRSDGRLLHVWRHGTAKLDAYLDDYACLANGLISLYEATFQPRWIDAAANLLDMVLKQFKDPAGGFFFTADDHEELIARQKDVTDASTPSASAMAATALVRLGKLTGRGEYLEAAQGALQSAAAHMESMPTAMGQSLLALELWLGPTYEIVLAGDGGSNELERAVENLRMRFLPNKVVALATGADKGGLLAELTAGKSNPGGDVALYVCEGFTCGAPAVGVNAIEAALDSLGAPLTNGREEK